MSRPPSRASNATDVFYRACVSQPGTPLFVAVIEHDALASPTPLTSAIFRTEALIGDIGIACQVDPAKKEEVMKILRRGERSLAFPPATAIALDHVFHIADQEETSISPIATVLTGNQVDATIKAAPGEGASIVVIPGETSAVKMRFIIHSAGAVFMRYLGPDLDNPLLFSVIGRDPLDDRKTPISLLSSIGILGVSELAVKKRFGHGYESYQDDRTWWHIKSVPEVQRVLNALQDQMKGQYKGYVFAITIERYDRQSVQGHFQRDRVPIGHPPGLLRCNTLQRYRKDESGDLVVRQGTVLIVIPPTSANLGKESIHKVTQSTLWPREMDVIGWFGSNRDINIDRKRIEKAFETTPITRSLVPYLLQSPHVKLVYCAWLTVRNGIRIDKADRKVYEQSVRAAIWTLNGAIKAKASAANRVAAASRNER